MFLGKVAAAPAGMLSSQKLTLCGAPETLTKRTTSPTCAETPAGRKWYTTASPDIRTTMVAFARLAAPLRDVPVANKPAVIKAALAANLEMVMAESIIGVWRWGERLI